MPSLILFLRRLSHYAFHLLGGVVIVMGLVALVLKFWLMPDVDRFRADLEAAASQAVGVPVRIGALEADWRGLNPRVTLRQVSLQPRAGEALVFPRVQAIGSWLSLAVLEPRLSQLSIEDARFPLRRSTEGTLFLADIPLNGPGDPSPFPDWLLRQGRIVIKDAHISWQDDQLGAPLLSLSRVRLLVENSFGRHRFGGVATPSDGARRLDLRGDFRGDSVHAPDSWSGLFYAQVRDARFQTWSQWVPWGQDAVRSGAGDLRFWLTVERGQAQALTGDARLSDVAVSMDANLPELRFSQLAGRIGWGRTQAIHTLYVDKLQFRIPEESRDIPLAEAANLRLTLTPKPAGGFSRVEVETANLRLEALTALSGALPLPHQGHDLITALAPQGLVENARGHWSGPRDYALNLRMREGGVRPYRDLPGVSGLDFSLEADQNQGKLTLGSKGLRLQWPGLFRHELGLDKLEAQADWRFDSTGLDIQFKAPLLSNADLDGSAKGQLLLPNQGSPVVDISAHLTRGEANAVYRYLPLKVGNDAYEWLRRGLLAGRSDDVRLRLKGDLGRFPFDQGGGEFQVRIRMLDGVLDYAEGWPRIEGVGGQLVFQGRGMHLLADRGRILNAQLGPVKVDIPDLHYTPDERVLVDGYARGDLSTFLDFIHRSPVNAYTDRFTEGFKAEGPGILALKLNLPVRRIDTATVGGAFTFQNNRLTAGKSLPPISQIQGGLTFTEKSLQGKNLQMHILGMPAQLELSSQSGAGLRVQLSGTASAEALKPHLPQALAGILRGSTRWQASAGLSGGGRASGLTLTSDLVGMAVDLPAPLGKNSGQAVPLEIDYRPGQAGGDGDRLQGQYGNMARAKALLPEHSQPRLNLHLGTGTVPDPTEAGLWISGNLNFVDLDAWRTRDWGTLADTRANEGSGIAFRQAALSFGSLRLFDRRFNETYVRVTPSGKGWNLQTAGKEIAGELVTVSETGGLRVLGNFKRLAIPEAQGRATITPNAAQGNTLTNLELNVQSLIWKQMELGELRLRMSPLKTGYHLDHFLLAPPEGRLEGSGMLSDHPRRPSRLKLKLTSQNLGKLMARMGHRDALKDGEGGVSGELGWMGGLEDFDVATLEGDLDLSVKKGQFLKVNPGAGRLVGVLSLQSLPRRINLDFKDVFSQGFAFDEVSGQVHIERGSAYTKDLRMNGPAAQVRMSGLVDLAQETQNLRLQIQPRLEDSVAVAGALLGGPVVGLGALLANKVLKNPIGQVVGFEYTVSGNWADPVITKVPRKTAAPDAEPAQ
ncbi:MAG: YhdP family protein [Pseudomonadota bacterium]